MMLFFSDPPAEDSVYMRFSVIPFDMIVEYLNLTSSSFVIPIVRTALLNVLNKTTPHVVNCYEVQRYSYVTPEARERGPTMDCLPTP